MQTKDGQTDGEQARERSAQDYNDCSSVSEKKQKKQKKQKKRKKQKSRQRVSQSNKELFLTLSFDCRSI